jgi:hypothetical protein
MKVQHIDPENGIIEPITINVIRWKYETMHEMYDVLSNDEYDMWGFCVISKIRADILMLTMQYEEELAQYIEKMDIKVREYFKKAWRINDYDGKEMAKYILDKYNGKYI